VKLLTYKNIGTFKKEYYKDLLTNEHLEDVEKYFKIVTDEAGNEYELNRFCYVLAKNGKKYLLSTQDRQNLPIEVTLERKLAHRNEAYYVIMGYNKAGFKKDKKKSLRELIDILSNFEHEQPQQLKVETMVTLAQMYYRSNILKCSIPGFGKDSRIGIFNGLFLKANSISNPTTAKLYLLSDSKLLVINEMKKVSAKVWDDLESYLLVVGDFNEEVTKNSRAIGGGQEIISISQLSLSILFNDIDSSSPKKFFQYRASDELKDRFFPMRYYGRFTEKFVDEELITSEGYVKKHWNEYIDLINTYSYYEDEQNLLKEMKPFNEPVLNFTNRWNTSLQAVLRIINVYSETQEEYDYWWNIILSCHEEYNEMLRFPVMLKRVCQKNKIKTDISKDIYQVQQVIDYLIGITPTELRNEKFKSNISELEKFTRFKEQSFKKRNNLMREYCDKDHSKPTIKEIKLTQW